MGWRASDGAGVVFSLASSGPDGKGSSSSSPRCIWQQLLFTAGYCTSRSVSPIPPPPLVSEGHISEGRERLPHIFTLHKVFCFNTLTSVSHYSCIQMYCTARPAALKSHSVLLLFHCDANQPFLFIDTFVHSKSQNAFLETYVSEALRQYPECLKHSEVFP